MFVPGPAAHDNGGTRINDATGQTWYRVIESRVNAAWFYNAPSHFLGDGTNLTITAADQAANPQWVGLPDPTKGTFVSNYPVGTYWDYVALQEWIYCLMADASIPGTITWNNNATNKNRPGFCPCGYMVTNQCLFIAGVGLDIEFAARRSSVITWRGNLTGTSNVGPAINMNSVSYAWIKGLTLADGFGCSNYLLAIDHYQSPIGLSPQANTFVDWTLSGGFGGVDVASGKSVMSQAAIAIDPLGGGSAQSDSQYFINLFLINNFYDGVVLLGSNIVACTFFGGNFQGCVRRGIYSVQGSYAVFSMITEMVGTDYFGSPPRNHFTLDGADFYHYPASFGGSDNDTIIGVRSESQIAIVDQAPRITLAQNYGIVSNASSSSPWAGGNHVHIGYPLFVDQSGATKFSVVIAVDDGGWPWFEGATSTSGTIVVNPNNPGWTVNQWVGYGVWLRFGSNGFTKSFNITANSDHTLTLGSDSGVTYPTFWKIFGESGATAPNWDAATRYGVASRDATGQGFSTTAGSNLVTIGSGVNPLVGDWMLVCGAYNFSQPDSPLVFQTALIGKVASIVGSQVALVDAHGNPVNASITQTDGFGYWSQPITDGQFTWMVIDWDVIYGVKQGINISAPYGRSTNCGPLTLDGGVFGGRSGGFIRGGASQGNPSSSYSYNNDASISILPATIGAQPSPLNLVYGFGAGNIGSARVLSYALAASAAYTINFPAGAPDTVDEFDLVLLQNNSSFTIVVTWGTNVAAASPTVSLGGVGNKTVIAHMKWIGARSGAPGAWYVQSVVGPL
jgi:hypothetical protein